jgi:hypothetical protein
MEFTRVKIVTFAPLANAEAVRDAIGSAGADRIGEYSYSTTGSGPKANPRIGSAEILETVQEDKTSL